MGSLLDRGAAFVSRRLDGGADAGFYFGMPVSAISLNSSGCRFSTLNSFTSATLVFGKWVN